jgi:hypothetical protein
MMCQNRMKTNVQGFARSLHKRRKINWNWGSWLSLCLIRMLVSDTGRISVKFGTEFTLKIRSWLAWLFTGLPFVNYTSSFLQLIVLLMLHFRL